MIIVWDSLHGHCDYCLAFLYMTYPVDTISHSAEIGNIFLKHKIKYRKSKTVLSNKSNDHTADYTLKKVYSTARYDTPSSVSVVLYVDGDRGSVTIPIMATHHIVIAICKGPEGSKINCTCKCSWSI
jgi:hypothetical protein